jgi:hypothetical protein
MEKSALKKGKVSNLERYETFGSWPDKPILVLEVSSQSVCDWFGHTRNRIRLTGARAHEK